MICQKCNTAPASVCVTQVVDSRKTDIYLCRNCANENAASKIKAAFGFTDAMPSHLVFGADHGFYVKQAETESCDECGITLAEIQKGGKLGCAYCYTAFRAKLRPIITRIHRSAQHRGKTPASAQKIAANKNGAANAEGANPAGVKTDGAAAGAGGNKTPADKTAGGNIPAGTYVGSRNNLKRLKASLTDAIHNEEYEKAAEIRDQIKAIESDGVTNL